MINETIKKKIVNYMNKFTYSYSNWYVGITNDPQARLFAEHKVSKEKGRWIYSKASTARGARDTEEYIINEYGTQGDVGGGDDLSKWVYAYHITENTKE